jgi:hypothetical protein
MRVKISKESGIPESILRGWMKDEEKKSKKQTLLTSFFKRN